MFKIGDFSKLSRVSVKALRYYDELGLLKPTRVDSWTGYRYYSAAQLPQLNRILALKDLGLSLDEIARLLQTPLPIAQLQGMLRLKQAELRQHIAHEQERLARIEARLVMVEQEEFMGQYEVVLKQVAPQLVASVQGVIPNMEQVNVRFNHLFDEVCGYVVQRGGKMLGPGLDRWLDPERRDTDIHVEALAPLQNSIPQSERVKVFTLEGVPTMASVIHHGSFAGLDQAYGAIMRWIEANSYRIAGPNREVYLEYDREGDPANYVTEIQFPVEKA